MDEKQINFYAQQYTNQIRENIQSAMRKPDELTISG